MTGLFLPSLTIKCPREQVGLRLSLTGSSSTDHSPFGLDGMYHAMVKMCPLYVAFHPFVDTADTSKNMEYWHRCKNSHHGWVLIFLLHALPRRHPSPKPNGVFPVYQHASNTDKSGTCVKGHDPTLPTLSRVQMRKQLQCLCCILRAGSAM